MLYSSIDIANFFVNRALKARRTITPMQVGKLTFLAHGWSLGLKKKPLLNEPVQAWKFGPVIPSVYFAFKGYGKEPITETAQAWDFDPSELPDIGEEDKSLLEQVYLTYSSYTGSQLSTLTHKTGSPWEQTVRPFNGQEELPRFLPIDNKVIEDYYRNKAAENARKRAN